MHHSNVVNHLNILCKRGKIKEWSFRPDEQFKGLYYTNICRVICLNGALITVDTLKVKSCKDIDSLLILRR